MEDSAKSGGLPRGVGGQRLLTKFISTNRGHTPSHVAGVDHFQVALVVPVGYARAAFKTMK